MLGIWCLMFRYLNTENYFMCVIKWAVIVECWSQMSIPLLGKKNKERNVKKNICSSTWNIHQHSNIVFHFFCFHRNYVGVFITQLLLWILHLCIQCDVQEMSQIIMSKLNQLQIQITYIHYAIIRRLCI